MLMSQPDSLNILLIDDETHGTRDYRSPSKKTSCFRSTCCVCFLTEEEQIYNDFNWCEFIFIYDKRHTDNSWAKMCAYYVCCPFTWIFSQFGLMISDNYTTVYAHAPTRNGENMFYHSPFGLSCCIDGRKWIIYKHFLCCCCCGTYGPNSGYDLTGATGLHAAGTFGFLQTAKYFLNFGDDIDGESTKNFQAHTTIKQTPLHLACYNKHENVIRFLVSKGADVNKIDSMGMTPLHYACQNNLTDMIALLIAHGANLYSDDGIHPIDLLPIKDSTLIKKLINLQGAALIKSDMNLMDSIAIGHLRSVVRIIQSSQISKQIMTDALALAIKTCRKSIALYLLSISVIKLPDCMLVYYGKALMRWAIEEGNMELIRYLLTQGVDVNAKVFKMNTCLHLAVICNNYEIVTMLIEHGACLDTENESNLKPLAVFRSAECKWNYFIQSIFPESLLCANSHIFWFRLVQLSDVDGIAERVLYYAKIYSYLVYAKNEDGHLAEDVATSANRDAIRKAYLWHGRYRLMDWRPEHTSATCLVFRAWDENSLDELGSPQRVALKLMRRKDQWQRELDIRRLITDSKSVIEIIRSHPESQLVDSFMTEEIDSECMNVVADMLVESESTTNKGEAERMYFLVMPLADRNMFVALKQDSWAGKSIEKWRHIFIQIANAIEDLHTRGILHADLKSLNIVRKNEWMLIDMDASCRIGMDSVGFKSSTAIMPPEAIYSNGTIICVKSQANNRLHTCGELMSHPSFDIWSLGVLLYQMANPEVKPLFTSSKDDNLSLDKSDDDNLWLLHAWSDDIKEKKMSKIIDPSLRGLISMILTKDPDRRPSISRILAHTAISNRKCAREGGSKATYDVFISYRVMANTEHAKKLYNLLTNTHGLKVWMDKFCLDVGLPWEVGFTNGLVSSRIFVCLMSKNAINNETVEKQNFKHLQQSSPCDNVLLEHRLALELYSFGYIDRIIPILIGEKLTSTTYSNCFADGSLPKLDELPDICVTSIEKKLIEHMERECLGTPSVPNHSVRSIFEKIMSYQALCIEGEEEEAFNTAGAKIASTVAVQ